MTPEEMQALIIKLTEENKGLTETNATLVTLDTTNKERMQALQEHNQKLFLEALHPEDKKKEKEEPEVLSPEDFAKTLKF